MKIRALLFASLLLTGCASSGGFVDDSTHLCGTGQPIEIEAGLQVAGHSGVAGTADAVAHVQVSNNSDEDVVIKSIRIDPQGDSSPLQLSGGGITVNREVKEGESEQFEIPLSAQTRDDRRSPTSTSLSFAVTVILADGDSYRCPFRVGVY